MNVPKEVLTLSNLAEAPLGVCPMPDQRSGPFMPLESGQQRKRRHTEWRPLHPPEVDMCVSRL